MANTEFNNIVFDNTATKTDFSPNNSATSDELLAPETYNYERVTNFAKLKRKIKVAKIAIFSVTITVTGGAIVVGLTQNKLGPIPPEIKEPVFTINNKILNYSFSLNNIKNYKVIFTIKNDKEVIYQTYYCEDEYFSNSYDLSNYSGSMCASLDYTNEVDHSGNLYTFNFEL